MSRPPILLDVPLPDLLRAQVEPVVEILPWSLLQDDPHGRLPSVQALYIYGHPAVDAALLDRLPGLRVVSNFGVGVDHIDLRAARARGIAVGHTPGAVDGATADMTFALLLAVARNLVRGDRFARGPEFTDYDPSRLLGLEVHGSRLGILGLGRIGKQVARRALAFDMEVVYHNRRRAPAAERELGVRWLPREELLATSHFVSLNVPLTPETRGLVGDAELRCMRADAVLVNAARGGVVDHDALCSALREGRIAGAALDVTEPEPLPRDHPLLQLDNLVIAPHLGSATVRTRERMGRMAVENLQAGLAGRSPPHSALETSGDASPAG